MKEIDGRILELLREIDKLETQLKQAQTIIQQVPQMIASRRGGILELEKTLKEKPKKNDK